MLRSEGFTLLELAVGLVMAAAVAGTAALQLPPVVASIRLAGAAHRLAAAMRQARGRALERNLRVDVRFDAVTRAWDVVEAGGATVDLQRLPAGVAFRGLPASGRVRFGTTGSADNATVMLGAGAAVRRVVVNQRGRVRVL